MEARIKKLLESLFIIQKEDATLEDWVRFGKEVRYVEFKDYSQLIERALLKGLALHGVDHQHFAIPGISILKLTNFDYDNPLLLALLRETLLPDPALEKYLTEERRKHTPPPFRDALEQQCILNEYAWFGETKTSPPEQLEEIPLLKPITDAVSKKVEQQYDENPYPRYQTVDAVSLDPITADNILVAGCGTGQHAIKCAIAAPKARVVAVDLSRSCLSYAIRKAREYNVTNITFLQGDILDLDLLGQQFDLIECSGVLHHMKDPVAGWKVLTRLLKPKGKMLVSLYSELARQHVVAARAFIEKLGFPPTPEGIRACRRAILLLPDSDPAKAVSQGIDFYSLSSCRDLLFHVQESRFTIPQIEKIITDLGLEFINFELSEPKNLSLKEWDAYEKKNPLTFLGMYHLWLRKPS